MELNNRRSLEEETTMVANMAIQIDHARSICCSLSWIEFNMYLSMCSICIGIGHCFEWLLDDMGLEI